MSAANSRMPALFLGHGNPMNAIEHNAYTAAWVELAAHLPRPAAILSVSAHWYVPGSRVTVEQQPRTIYDFGGFPRALYEVAYPAPGDPELAQRARGMLAPTQVIADESWGLDHGTWSLLVHLYPDADVPVVQLSIDETLTARQHFDLGGRLRGLRDAGVLILGSGNVVHNLHAYAWGAHAVEPYDWAIQFETRLRQLIETRQFASVAGYEGSPEAALVAPTPDHFLPLLYVLAQADPDDPLAFPVEGFDGGSISMLGVRVG
jgi:4,5-DOPA dioxygenase extradiol